MPAISAFTPFGMLAFSSEPSRAEAIYDALTSLHGGQYNLDPGTHEEAELYMTAMSVARARYALERAENQYNPLLAQEMLPAHEHDFGVVPAETESILDRQLAIAVREKYALGSRYSALSSLLSDMLGARFVGLRVVHAAEEAPVFGPSNFIVAGSEYKVIRHAHPIAFVGTPVTVAYAPYISGDAESVIRAGDVITVSPENNGNVEQVTATSASASTYTATFTKAHDAGCAGTTSFFPNWSSNQRYLYVVTNQSAAVDQETIRKVGELMARTATAGTQWAVVQPTSAGATTIGPFTVGTSALGTTTISQITLF